MGKIKVLNEEIDITGLQDGYYLLEYGDGWIRGNKPIDIVASGVTENGGVLGLGGRTEVETITEVTFSASTEFTAGLIQASIELSTGLKSETKNAIQYDYLYTSPIGKRAFGRLYKTYCKDIIIKIVGGVIKNKGINYTPTGLYLKTFTTDMTSQRSSNSRILTRNLDEVVDRCIYDVEHVKPVQIIEPNGKVEKGLKIYGDKVYITQNYGKKEIINIFFQSFTVGVYEISTQLKNDAMILFKVDERKRLVKVAETVGYSNGSIFANLENGHEYILKVGARTSIQPKIKFRNISTSLGNILKNTSIEDSIGPSWQVISNNSSLKTGIKFNVPSIGSRRVQFSVVEGIHSGKFYFVERDSVGNIKKLRFAGAISRIGSQNKYFLFSERGEILCIFKNISGGTAALNLISLIVMRE
ncbi:enterotoxin [uncultured Clostridium sp.]|jgi:hypothetical protein|uniref:enterotoxin n=1 Tax=uncultured Clostridium sp. TaxID=59620 RepID=UPI002613AA23|nr:enterotoxin [uncultured Clostridium sp.]